MSSADWSTKAIIIIQHALTSIVGIVGNVLVLIVYKKRLRDKETITFFIVHLALTDLACCLFLIPLNCYHELYIGAITSDFMCKFHSFLNIVNITYSCLLMTLVACERCFSIVYPFRRIVTKTRAKIAMAGLFAFCFGIALTSCLGIGIYHRVHRVFANFDVLNYNLSDFYNDYHLPPPSSQSQPSPSNIDYYAASAMVSPMATLTTTRSFQNRHGKQLRGVVVANNMILHKREIVSDYGFVISTNRSKREMMPISNVTQWMKTTNCFPNDQIIPLQYISYLRLFQNLIVVGCFTTIFVLYALICVRVTQRRQLKADRDQYYKELLDRSKRNTMMVNAAPETSPKTFEKRNSREKKASSSSSNHQLHMMTHEISDPLLGTATTITNDLKSLSSMHDQETSLVAPLPNISSPDVENTKSTQTVKSSISYIKNSQSVSSNMAANGAANQKRSMSMSKVKSQSISNQRVRSSCCSQNQNNVNGGEVSPKKACGRLDVLTHHQSISNQSQPDQSSVYAQVRYTNAILANLKTAFMLFVVTLIMAIVYTPSLLTSLHIIDYNPIHWNIIYINNAVNPIVYSFLNYNFRKNLKTTLKFAWNRLFRSNSDLDLTK